MATQQSTVDFILDQISSAGEVSAKKMFGEYALYCNGKVIGLVCDDTLYIKITPTGKSFAGDLYAEGFAYPGAKASMLIDGSLIEDREWITKLAEITAGQLPTPKPKSRVRK